MILAKKTITSQYHLLVVVTKIACNSLHPALVAVFSNTYVFRDGNPKTKCSSFLESWALHNELQTQACFRNKSPSSVPVFFWM